MNLSQNAVHNGVDQQVVSRFVRIVFVLYEKRNAQTAHGHLQHVGKSDGVGFQVRNVLVGIFAPQANQLPVFPTLKVGVQLFQFVAARLLGMQLVAQKLFVRGRLCHHVHTFQQVSFQPLKRCKVASLENWLQTLLYFAEFLFGDGGKEVFFARKMVVERAFCFVRRAGDVVHRCFVEPEFGE